MPMKESDYDALCRMARNDSLEGLAEAFRSIAPQWPGITARQFLIAMTEVAVEEEKQKEPELPHVASGGSYL